MRQLVGHFREAYYAEESSVGKVKAKFVPISGPGYEWVISLIESALDGVPGRPLVGISINGYGTGDEAKDGWNDIREIGPLESADLVTRAGAGGEFHRRLSESLAGARRAAVTDNATLTPKQLR